ncbi:unnamed protein product [Spodoptera exigua]|nr:unnamed protein product [Spodoptera exigua]
MLRAVRLGLVVVGRRATLTRRPQARAYGGHRSSLDPRRTECRLLQEEDSLTRSTSFFASITASHKEETKSGRVVLRHEWVGSTGVIPRPHRKPASTLTPVRAVTPVSVLPDSLRVQRYRSHEVHCVCLLNVSDPGGILLCTVLLRFVIIIIVYIILKYFYKQRELQCSYRWWRNELEHDPKYSSSNSYWR